MNAGSTTPSQSGSDLSLVKERKIGSYPAKANRLTTAALSDIFLPHGVRRCAGAALRERGVARAWRYAGRGVARGAAIRGRGETRVRRYAGAALRGRGDTWGAAIHGRGVRGKSRQTGLRLEADGRNTGGRNFAGGDITKRPQSFSLRFCTVCISRQQNCDRADRFQRSRHRRSEDI